MLAAAGVKKNDQRFKELKAKLPGFDILQTAVRAYIQRHEKSEAPLAKLHSQQRSFITDATDATDALVCRIPFPDSLRL